MDIGYFKMNISLHGNRKQYPRLLLYSLQYAQRAHVYRYCYDDGNDSLSTLVQFYSPAAQATATAQSTVPRMRARMHDVQRTIQIIM